MRKILDNTIIGAFFALFAVTPFLFNPTRSLPSFELFEWNKMIFVYGLTVVAGVAWVLKIIFYGDKWRRTPFDLTLGLFLMTQTLSTVFSIDRHVSFFGYYSRFNGGLLSTVCYILLFYAFVHNFPRRLLPKLIFVTLCSGFIVAVYGIFEKFGIDAQMWVQDVRARVFSTLGQPNWLAAYLAILMPFTVKNLLPDNNSGTPFHHRWWVLNWIYITAGSAIYICLLFTRSRSGFLGFWLAMAVFWPLFLFFKKNSGNLAFILKINIVFFILTFIFRSPFPQYNRFLSLDIFNPNQPVAETAPPVGDSVINVGITDSADIRKIVWKGAWEITKAFPLLGTGPETFAYAYYKYRPQEHNLTSEWDFLYNKAHNEYLNFLATGGWIGFASYIALIGWTLYVSGRTFFRTRDMLTAAIIASYISILVTNFFGFSVVLVNLFFFLIPGWLTIIADTFEIVPASRRKLSRRQTAAAVATVAGGLFIIYGLFTYWAADSLYARAVSSGKQGELTQAYKYASAAVGLKPGEPVYLDELADISGSLAAVAYANEDATLSAQLAQQALSATNRSIDISPQNVTFWKTRTRIYYSLSEINPEYNPLALESILVTQELAPTDAKIAYNVGIIYGRNGNNDLAIKALNKAIELKPDYRDAYIALAIFYEDSQNRESARRILETALKKINPNDEEIKARLEKL